MNRTIEDSQEYDVVCMSFGKEKQKGINVEQAGQKDSFLSETMEIKAQSCTANDMKFSKEQMEILNANRKARKTVKALTKKSVARGR